MPPPISPQPRTPTALISLMAPQSLTLAPGFRLGILEYLADFLRDARKGKPDLARQALRLAPLETVEHLFQPNLHALVVASVRPRDRDATQRQTDTGYQHQDLRECERRRDQRGRAGQCPAEQRHHRPPRDAIPPQLADVGLEPDQTKPGLELHHLGRDLRGTGQRIAAPPRQCPLNRSERAGFGLPRRAVGVVALRYEQLVLRHPAGERALDRCALSRDDAMADQGARSSQPGPGARRRFRRRARLLLEHRLPEISLGDPDVFPERQHFLARQPLADLLRSCLQLCGAPDDSLQGFAVDQVAHNASTMTAAPCPPPIHADPSPKRFFSRRSACSRWIVMRVPLAASGCPMAIAPPHTLVRDRSRSSSRSTARYCGANASFTSTRSICSSFIFAFSSALRAAGAGPMPMCFGSTPATAQATSRPRGFRPRAFAYSSLAMTVAAPPSEMPDAFPAVTSPSFLK